VNALTASLRNGQGAGLTFVTLMMSSVNVAEPYPAMLALPQKAAEFAHGLGGGVFSFTWMVVCADAGPAASASEATTGTAMQIRLRAFIRFLSRELRNKHSQLRP
jgi:hypothetical protein